MAWACTFFADCGAALAASRHCLRDLRGVFDPSQSGRPRNRSRLALPLGCVTTGAASPMQARQPQPKRGPLNEAEERTSHRARSSGVAWACTFFADCGAALAASSRCLRDLRGAFDPSQSDRPRPRSPLALRLECVTTGAASPMQARQAQPKRGPVNEAEERTSHRARSPSPAGRGSG